MVLNKKVIDYYELNDLRACLYSVARAIYNFVKDNRNSSGRFCPKDKNYGVKDPESQIFLKAQEIVKKEGVKANTLDLKHLKFPVYREMVGVYPLYIMSDNMQIGGGIEYSLEREFNNDNELRTSLFGSMGQLLSRTLNYGFLETAVKKVEEKKIDLMAVQTVRLGLYKIIENGSDPAFIDNLEEQILNYLDNPSGLKNPKPINPIFKEKVMYLTTIFNSQEKVITNPTNMLCRYFNTSKLEIKPIDKKEVVPLDTLDEEKVLMDIS